MDISCSLRPARARWAASAAGRRAAPGAAGRCRSLRSCGTACGRSQSTSRSRRRRRTNGCRGTPPGRYRCTWSTAAAHPTWKPPANRPGPWYGSPLPRPPVSRTQLTQSLPAPPSLPQSNQSKKLCSYRAKIASLLLYWRGRWTKRRR
jgi:hypothetical protein